MNFNFSLSLSVSWTGQQHSFYDRGCMLDLKMFAKRTAIRIIESRFLEKKLKHHSSQWDTFIWALNDLIDRLGLGPARRNMWLMWGNKAIHSLLFWFFFSPPKKIRFDSAGEIFISSICFIGGMRNERVARVVIRLMISTGLSINHGP